jgi:hypothetical protein
MNDSSKHVEREPMSQARDLTHEARELTSDELKLVSGGGFKMVAVKTISWAHDDEAPKETTTFEYGGG